MESNFASTLLNPGAVAQLGDWYLAQAFFCGLEPPFMARALKRAGR
jgi:hypothetical protein